VTTRAAKSRGMPKRSKGAARSSSPPWLLIVGGVAAIAVVAILAVFLSQPASGEISEPATKPLAIEGQSLPGLPDSGTDAAVGQALPRLVGTGVKGEIVEIGPANGAQAIVVVAHWCPHCQVEIPQLSAWLADHPLPEGVRLVTLSTAIDPARPNYPPSAWLEREGWPGPVLTDDAESSGLASLGLNAFPGFVFVNADGTVASRATGEVGTDAFAAGIASIAP
jgi:thiol-disulfide isomerase/thioredoxin